MMRRKGRRTALIIPDAHASPDYGNARFDWLGRLAQELDPDYIVCLGDWWDFPSLSKHDPLGSRTMEGVRYSSDLASGHDGMARFFNGYQRAGARKLFFLGNHDVRPDIAANQDPRWDGTISTADLRLKEYGWEVTPYRETTTLEGISISHHMTAGLMGRPIGGEHMAAALVKKKHVSCIVGHSHIYQHFEHTRGDGQKIFGLSAGCYSHPHYGRDNNLRSNWCRDTSEMWWRGVVILSDLDGHGYYDSIESITMRKIQREYSR